MLQGQIDSFWISKKQYSSKPGRILVVNTRKFIVYAITSKLIS
ncbi:hypothetical protein OQI87_09290 [Lactobacillus kefiranofaciens]|nr:hypothetical protein [Lactobacillus kefiranofaciens]MDH5101259.1 hypothetical protein [Lactobacillus kefiranofaciens]